MSYLNHELDLGTLEERSRGRQESNGVGLNLFLIIIEFLSKPFKKVSISRHWIQCLFTNRRNFVWFGLI